MKHVIHPSRDKDVLRDVMLDEPETIMPRQVLDVFYISGNQVIQAGNVMPLFQEPVTKMRFEGSMAIAKIPALWAPSSMRRIGSVVWAKTGSTTPAQRMATKPIRDNQLLTLFIQLDLVSPQSNDSGCLQAGGAPADHDHLFLRR